MTPDLGALLETDLDTHLMTLKFLGMFPGDYRAQVETDGSGWASLVRIDASLFAWDRQNYPGIEGIVWFIPTMDRFGKSVPW
jgi:hypothetical protein